LYRQKVDRLLNVVAVGTVSKHARQPIKRGADAGGVTDDKL